MVIKKDHKVSEFADKIQKIYELLESDPDYQAEGDQTREEVILNEAVQRAKQHDRNVQALSLLNDFVSKGNFLKKAKARAKRPAQPREQITPTQVVLDYLKTIEAGAELIGGYEQTVGVDLEILVNLFQKAGADDQWILFLQESAEELKYLIIQENHFSKAVSNAVDLQEAGFKSGALEEETEEAMLMNWNYDMSKLGVPDEYRLQNFTDKVAMDERTDVVIKAIRSVLQRNKEEKIAPGLRLPQNWRDIYAEEYGDDEVLKNRYQLPPPKIKHEKGGIKNLQGEDPIGVFMQATARNKKKQAAATIALYKRKYAGRILPGLRADYASDFAYRQHHEDFNALQTDRNYNISEFAINLLEEAAKNDEIDIEQESLDKLTALSSEERTEAMRIIHQNIEGADIDEIIEKVTSVTHPIIRQRKGEKAAESTYLDLGDLNIEESEGFTRADIQAYLEELGGIEGVDYAYITGDTDTISAETGLQVGFIYSEPTVQGRAPDTREEFVDDTAVMPTSVVFAEETRIPMWEEDDEGMIEFQATDAETAAYAAGEIMPYDDFIALIEALGGMPELHRELFEDEKGNMYTNITFLGDFEDGETQTRIEQRPKIVMVDGEPVQDGNKVTDHEVLYRNQRTNAEIPMERNWFFLREVGADANNEPLGTPVEDANGNLIMPTVKVSREKIVQNQNRWVPNRGVRYTELKDGKEVNIDDPVQVGIDHRNVTPLLDDIQDRILVLPTLNTTINFSGKRYLNEGESSAQFQEGEGAWISRGTLRDSTNIVNFQLAETEGQIELIPLETGPNHSIQYSTPNDKDFERIGVLKGSGTNNYNPFGLEVEPEGKFEIPSLQQLGLDSEEDGVPIIQKLIDSGILATVSDEHTYSEDDVDILVSQYSPTVTYKSSILDEVRSLIMAELQDAMGGSPSAAKAETAKQRLKAVDAAIDGWGLNPIRDEQGNEIELVAGQNIRDNLEVIMGQLGLPTYNKELGINDYAGYEALNENDIERSEDMDYIYNAEGEIIEERPVSRSYRKEGKYPRYKLHSNGVTDNPPVGGAFKDEATKVRREKYKKETFGNGEVIERGGRNVTVYPLANSRFNIVITDPTNPENKQVIGSLVADNPLNPSKYSYYKTTATGTISPGTKVSAEGIRPEALDQFSNELLEDTFKINNIFNPNSVKVDTDVNRQAFRNLSRPDQMRVINDMRRYATMNVSEYKPKFKVDDYNIWEEAVLQGVLDQQLSSPEVEEVDIDPNEMQQYGQAFMDMGESAVLANLLAQGASDLDVLRAYTEMFPPDMGEHGTAKKAKATDGDFINFTALLLRQLTYEYEVGKEGYNKEINPETQMPFGWDNAIRYGPDSPVVKFSESNVFKAELSDGVIMPLYTPEKIIDVIEQMNSKITEELMIGGEEVEDPLRDALRQLKKDLFDTLDAGEEYKIDKDKLVEVLPLVKQTFGDLYQMSAQEAKERAVNNPVYKDLDLSKFFAYGSQTQRGETGKLRANIQDFIYPKYPKLKAMADIMNPEYDGDEPVFNMLREMNLVVDVPQPNGSKRAETSLAALRDIFELRQGNLDGSAVSAQRAWARIPTSRKLEIDVDADGQPRGLRIATYRFIDGRWVDEVEKQEGLRLDPNLDQLTPSTLKAWAEAQTEEGYNKTLLQTEGGIPLLDVLVGIQEKLQLNGVDMDWIDAELSYDTLDTPEGVSDLMRTAMAFKNSLRMLSNEQLEGFEDDKKFLDKILAFPRSGGWANMSSLNLFNLDTNPITDENKAEQYRAGIEKFRAEEENSALSGRISQKDYEDGLLKEISMYLNPEEAEAVNLLIASQRDEIIKAVDKHIKENPLEVERKGELLYSNINMMLNEVFRDVAPRNIDVLSNLDNYRLTPGARHSLNDKRQPDRMTEDQWKRVKGGYIEQLPNGRFRLVKGTGITDETYHPPEGYWRVPSPYTLDWSPLEEGEELGGIFKGSGTSGWKGGRLPLESIAERRKLIAYDRWIHGRREGEPRMYVIGDEEEPDDISSYFDIITRPDQDLSESERERVKEEIRLGIAGQAELAADDEGNPTHIVVMPAIHAETILEGMDDIGSILKGYDLLMLKANLTEMEQEYFASGQVLGGAGPWSDLRQALDIYEERVGDVTEVAHLIKGEEIWDEEKKEWVQSKETWALWKAGSFDHNTRQLKLGATPLKSNLTQEDAIALASGQSVWNSENNTFDVFKETHIAQETSVFDLDAVQITPYILKLMGIKSKKIQERLLSSPIPLDVQTVKAFIDQIPDLLAPGKQWKKILDALDPLIPLLDIETNPEIANTKLARIKEAKAATDKFIAAIFEDDTNDLDWGDDVEKFPVNPELGWLRELLTNTDGERRNEVFDGLNQFFVSKGLPNTRSYKQEQDKTAVFTAEGLKTFQAIIQTISSFPKSENPSGEFENIGIRVGEDIITLDEEFYWDLFDQLDLLDSGDKDEGGHGPAAKALQANNAEDAVYPDGRPIKKVFGWVGEDPPPQLADGINIGEGAPDHRATQTQAENTTSNPEATSIEEVKEIIESKIDEKGNVNIDSDIEALLADDDAKQLVDKILGGVASEEDLQALYAEHFDPNYMIEEWDQLPDREEPMPTDFKTLTPRAKELLEEAGINWDDLSDEEKMDLGHAATQKFKNWIQDYKVAQEEGKKKEGTGADGENVRSVEETDGTEEGDGKNVAAQSQDQQRPNLVPVTPQAVAGAEAVVSPSIPARHTFYDKLGRPSLAIVGEDKKLALYTVDADGNPVAPLDVTEYKDELDLIFPLPEGMVEDIEGQAGIVTLLAEATIEDVVEEEQIIEAGIRDELNTIDQNLQQAYSQEGDLIPKDMFEELEHIRRQGLSLEGQNLMQLMEKKFGPSWEWDWNKKQAFDMTTPYGLYTYGKQDSSWVKGELKKHAGQALQQEPETILNPDARIDMNKNINKNLARTQPNADPYSIETLNAMPNEDLIALDKELEDAKAQQIKFETATTQKRNMQEAWQNIVQPPAENASPAELLQYARELKAFESIYWNLKDEKDNSLMDDEIRNMIPQLHQAIYANPKLDQEALTQEFRDLSGALSEKGANKEQIMQEFVQKGADELNQRRQEYQKFQNFVDNINISELDTSELGEALQEFGITTAETEGIGLNFEGMPLDLNGNVIEYDTEKYEYRPNIHALVHKELFMEHQGRMGESPSDAIIYQDMNTAFDGEEIIIPLEEPTERHPNGSPLLENKSIVITGNDKIIPLVANDAIPTGTYSPDEIESILLSHQIGADMSANPQNYEDEGDGLGMTSLIISDTGTVQSQGPENLTNIPIVDAHKPDPSAMERVTEPAKGAMGAAARFLQAVESRKQPKDVAPNVMARANAVRSLKNIARDFLNAPFGIMSSGGIGNIIPRSDTDIFVEGMNQYAQRRYDQEKIVNDHKHLLDSVLNPQVNQDKRQQIMDHYSIDENHPKFSVLNEHLKDPKNIERMHGDITRQLVNPPDVKPEKPQTAVERLREHNAQVEYDNLQRQTQPPPIAQTPSLDDFVSQYGPTSTPDVTKPVQPRFEGM